jgi:hypothetical protein
MIQMFHVLSSEFPLFAVTRNIDVRVEYEYWSLYMTAIYQNLNEKHKLKMIKNMNAVFWDVTPCRSCVNRRFGGTYCLHLQGRKIRER